MPVLFPNTGVQYVCFPLASGQRFSSAATGFGWQYCRCKQNGELKTYPYVQWQITQLSGARLFFAIDTTCGDPQEGHFADASTLSGDFSMSLNGLLDLEGKEFPGLPKLEIVIRPADAGLPKPVDLVVDFGNSRTGGLLLETSGDAVGGTPPMEPLEMVDRLRLDNWNAEGEFVRRSRWLPSKTHWCVEAYLPPLPLKKTIYKDVERKGLLGKKTETVAEEIDVQPSIFEDFSLVRMGREADEVTRMMGDDGAFRTGVSSPKRYLWAHDASWLDGADWHMADPTNRTKSGRYAARLQGRLLRYLHENDTDLLIEQGSLSEVDFASEAPLKPRHAPRTLMTAALYELLCQAYAYVNSEPYRRATGDPNRRRTLNSLTLTYPSGMIRPERERFRRQALKAIKIFHQTVGKSQADEPQLTLSLDEASAVHLTYIWSELEFLGGNAELWFSLVQQQRGSSTAPAPEQEAPSAPAAEAAPAAPSVKRTMQRPGRPVRRVAPTASGGAAGAAAKKSEVRIACIDIGGGTSDLMIARYALADARHADLIQGDVLHQDGVSVAGDQLVKRLLEVVVVPIFAEAAGLDPADAHLLFGPQERRNREFRMQRIRWMNNLFVPLAQRYLDLAVAELSEVEISHTDPETVEPDVLDALEDALTRIVGPGRFNVRQSLGLYFDRGLFEEVVESVFGELLYDFCSRIVEHQADIVLLAGQPTRIRFLQELVQMYLPLPASRIIPMSQHYAGNWYPYQDQSGQRETVIVDPKSAVVVGAAIEFLARKGKLPQFKFKMKDRQAENRYFWGIMRPGSTSILSRFVLFSPEEDAQQIDLPVTSESVIIGRKFEADENAQASPIYQLRVDSGGKGDIEAIISLRRVRGGEHEEESLEVVNVAGTVAGQPAVLGENVTFNWRTLAEERFYLDTGGLDNIEL